MLARLVAEQGHAVVVGGFRGLQESEGRFDPFRADGADGADLVDWIGKQPWCEGPLVLQGLGYAGHAAWATLASARRAVDGLVAGFTARDPYAWLHTGGALQLDSAVRQLRNALAHFNVDVLDTVRYSSKVPPCFKCGLHRECEIGGMYMMLGEAAKEVKITQDMFTRWEDHCEVAAAVDAAAEKLKNL